MSRVVFQVPAIDAKRGLDGDAFLAYEDEVGFPNAVVLSDGESAEGSIEGMTCPGD